jgi:hypothetical protein
VWLTRKVVSCSCWPACRRGREGLTHVGFLVGRGALRKFYLRLLPFSALSLIPPMSHSHIPFVYHKL